MKKLSHQKIVWLQAKILLWYKDNARDLPWRRTTDPYHILVSEIMSQQTQVERVKAKYTARLKAFPTVADLADASQTEVLRLRSGLGYNRRGLNLWKAAKEITENPPWALPAGRQVPPSQRGLSGKQKTQNSKLKIQNYFPQTEAALLALPGVGLYTAHAVMAFAYNLPVPVLDINIKRVLITELSLPTDSSDKELRQIAQTLIPKGKSRERHNALMDYGALILTSKKTGIRSAPQSTFVGSTRWVRGNVLKRLLKYGPTAISTLKQKYPHEQFDTIILGMMTEGIISKKAGKLSIADEKEPLTKVQKKR